MLMGATLPLLVEQRVQSSRDVGHSVATLYFANTLGSAFACFFLRPDADAELRSVRVRDSRRLFEHGCRGNGVSLR